MTRNVHHPRRAEQALGVIDHDARAVADAHAAHARGKFLRRRQHVGQGALGVGNLVDIEEHGARNMLLEIFLPRVAPIARHVPGGIDDDEIGRLKLAFEFVGLG
jgi:hypothetical protein